MTTLVAWSIFESPKDFPGLFVARQFLMGQPTEEKRLSSSLDGVRKLIPQGLYRLQRSPSDHRSVVETWI